MDESPLVMKLLIDNKRQRVLFAEAGKDCVDFLFYILSLRVATVISLLSEQNTVGSLVNLYHSVEKLNDSYILPNQTKDSLLKPVSIAAEGSFVPLLLLNGAAGSALWEKKVYTCVSHSNNYSVSPSAVCPKCKWKMTKEMSFVAHPVETQKARSSKESGFVKGLVTYMVMDDLSVMPISAISSITLINKFGIGDAGVLEEKEVNLSMDEAVKLLNACLQSKTVLSDVFLKK